MKLLRFSALCIALVFTVCASLHAAGNLPGQNPLPDISDPLTLEFWAEVDEATPSITLKFLYSSHEATVYRREHGQSAWNEVAILPAAAADWTDSNVEIGTAYEYIIERDTVIGPTTAYEYGYTLAGIRVDRALHRGTLILVLAENIVQHNVSRIEQLYQDLVGDGWNVKTIFSPYFNHNPFEGKGDTSNQANGMWGHRYPEVLRNRIREIYAEDPNGVKLIYFLGHTPMALTGSLIRNEDGHGYRGIYPSDHYYADIDGIWTDNENNVSESFGAVMVNLAFTVPNLPGDGMWDANTVGSKVEMGFGRVDPWDRRGNNWYSPAMSESERIARYLDKAHKYRHVEAFGFPGQEDFAGRKAMMRGPSGQEGANHSSAQFLNLVGPSNMDDYISTQTVPSPVAPISNGDIQITVNQGPYLFWGQSSAGPTLNDKYRQSVFNHGNQSWWGDWHIDEAIRKSLMNENMVLSWLYAGWKFGELFNQAMGLGVPIGDAMLTTINDGSVEAILGDPDAGQDNPLKNEFYRVVMADPALRIFMVPGVSNLMATPNGGNVDLTWTAPIDMTEFVEYRVWRASDTMGDFQMIASGLNSPSYTDTSAPTGSNTYMVQAAHLVEGGSGSFLSNSQGEFVRVGLSLDTYVLSPFPVGEAMAFNFAASNANGSASWSVVSGHLPDGVTLAPDGLLSGTPVVAGEYPVRVSVGDDDGSLERDFVIFVDAAFTEVIDMDLRQNGGLGLYDRAMPTRPVSLMGDAQLDAVEGMIFDGDGDALRLHNIGDLSAYSNGGGVLLQALAADVVGVEQWPDFSYTPAGAPFAVALSFKADPSSQGGVLISKSQNRDSNFTVNKDQFTVMMKANGTVQGSVRHISPIVSSASYNDGEWHSLVYTYDKDFNKMRLFIDGVLIGESIYSKVKVDDDLLVGARWDGPGESAVTDSFNGRIADLKVFSSEVKDGEASALYERLVRTRADLNPQAPSIHGLPQSVDVTLGETFTFPLSVTDPNGEPLRLFAKFEHPELIHHSEFVKTLSGYEWKVIVNANFAFPSTVTVGVEDGYPGHVYSVPLDFNYSGPVNDSYSLGANGPHLLDVLANDQFVSGHTYIIDSIESQPVYTNDSLGTSQVGAVDIVGNKIKFYPAIAWNHPVEFTYVLRDLSSGEANTATVTLSPSSVPLAVDDSFFVSSPGTVTLDVLANDTDPMGEDLELIKVEQPVFGKAVINGNKIDLSNTDESTITYTIRNESGFTATASVLFKREVPIPILADLNMDEGAGLLLSNSGTLGGAVSGTLSGAMTWVDSILGKAVLLASGEHISLGNPAALNFNPATDDFSITLDFESSNQIRTPSSYPMTLISKESGNAGDAQLAVVLEKVNTEESISVYIKGERVVVNEVEPYAYDRYENMMDLVLAENKLRWGHPDDALKSWHHFALINDATNHRLKVYIDQWLLADVDTSGMDLNQGDNGGDWLIGASPDGSGGWKNHLMLAVDNLRFYDKAIGESQLKSAFSALNFSMRKMAPTFLSAYPADGTEIELNKDYQFRIQHSVEDPDPGETGILRSTGLERTTGDPFVTWSIILDGINDPAWPVPSLTSYPIHNGQGDIVTFNSGDISAERIIITFSQKLSTYQIFDGNYASGDYHSWTISYPIVSNATPVPDALSISTPSDLGAHPSITALNIAIEAMGGAPAYTWTVLSGILPPGLNLDANTGELSGAVTVAGVYSFTLAVSDGSGQSEQREFAITINPADSDADKIADDWELAQLGTLGASITDDGDGDGLSLMQEYVLALNATQSAPKAYLMKLSEKKGPVSSGDDSYISFEYCRRSSLPNHSVSVEFSTDMLNWSAVSALEVIMEDNGIIQKVRVDVPKDTHDTLFLRLKVSEL